MTSTLGQAPPVASPSRLRTAPRRPRRRRLILVTAAGAVVLLAVTTLLVTGRSGGHARQRLWTYAAPSAYSVTYAVTTAGAAPSTERLWVRRPFDAVDITYAGPPPAGTQSLQVVYRLGVQVLKAANAQAGQLRIPAGPPPQDVRPDVVLPAALQARALAVVGLGRVLGRQCQVVRTATPLRAGPLPPLRSTSTYVNTCIDRAGIMLRETQVGAGRVVAERRAVQVQTGDAAVDGVAFDLTGTPTPFDSGGGAFTPLTMTSRPPGGSWSLPSPPAGFRQVGRYAVVPPQPQLFGAGGDGYGSMALPGGLVTEMDDVFVSGPDFLVLQQGSTLAGATFSPPANGSGVDLGPLGSGQLLVAAGASTVVAEPGNRKGFVRLSGTMPPDELIRLMRGLVKQPGGTLTRLRPSGGGGAAG